MITIFKYARPNEVGHELGFFIKGGSNFTYVHHMIVETLFIKFITNNEDSCV